MKPALRERAQSRTVRAARAWARGFSLVRRGGLVRGALIAVGLHVHVDKLGGATDGVEEAPALHPIIGALQLLGRDRRRIDHEDAALAQVVDRELGDLGILVLVVVDEIVEVSALVGIDAALTAPRR